MPQIACYATMILSRLNFKLTRIFTARSIGRGRKGIVGFNHLAANLVMNATCTNAHGRPIVRLYSTTGVSCGGAMLMTPLKIAQRYESNSPGDFVVAA